MGTGKAASRIPFRERLTVRLTGAVVLVLLGIGVPFLLIFQRLLRTQQIEVMTETTTSLSRVVVDGLRSSMLAGQPHLLDEVVRNLAERPEIERAILLNHQGRVSVSSDPEFEGAVLDRSQDRTCQACHSEGGETPRSRTIVTDEAGRRQFRSMTLIPNQPACHRCHDPASSSNGILLMDLAMVGPDRRVLANIGTTVILGAAMALLTVLTLVILLRRMVHAPLEAVVTTGRAIVDGDLESRARVDQPGEFGVLASQVNKMTDHLAKSLATVDMQRRELQETLESVDDEIVVLDRDQRVVAANKAFRERCRDPHQDHAGRHCRDVTGSQWPCSTQETAGCPVHRVFTTGRSHRAIFSQTEADGKERVIEIHASPLRGPEGIVDRAVEVRRDISERRNMEAMLSQSERLASLGLLASGISHEINNPLGSILTSVEGLRRRIASEPEVLLQAPGAVEEALIRIGQQVQRGRQITDRLLKMARPKGSQRVLIDVNSVVEDTVGILSHDMQRSHVTCRLALADKLPPLPGDESSFRQLMMNLSLNAVQSMASGGELSIATITRDHAVQIEVKDRGCGIPPEHLRRIYEPFFSTKPSGKGTGLGLFITHRIVDEWGGTIHAESTVGKGTSFRVVLPFRESGGAR